MHPAINIESVNEIDTAPGYKRPFTSGIFQPRLMPVEGMVVINHQQFLWKRVPQTQKNFVSASRMLAFHPINQAFDHQKMVG